MAMLAHPTMHCTQVSCYLQSLLPIIVPMDPYTWERWILENHEAVIREAELRSRLLPQSERSAGFNTWIAWRLRALADRLDGRGSFEKATQ